MPFTLDIPYRSSVLSARGVEGTFEWLSDWPISIGRAFPGLKTFRETEPNRYAWEFDEIGYQSFRLTIVFQTRKETQAPKSVSCVPLSGPHKIQFQWRLSPVGGGCRADFEAKITLDVPAPSLMKGLVTGFAEKELRSLLERYLQHVEKALRA